MAAGIATTLDVVVGVVGIVLTGDDATVGALDGSDVAEALDPVGATVIGGSETAVPEDAGAGDAPVAEDDPELVLGPELAVVVPEVQAVTSTISPTIAETGARRRAENMELRPSQDPTNPRQNSRSPPSPTDVDGSKDTVCAPVE
ncbi:hypothetical protein ABIB25_001192 [Nakamurella sp. UYEF19]|uniref:hypothetical protein n=1 Tax=Nakamurella sp. UYEF19 TaxID=1756392 RepID=UPI00339232C1